MNEMESDVRKKHILSNVGFFSYFTEKMRKIMKIFKNPME